MKCESILSTAPFYCVILYFAPLQSKKGRNAPFPIEQLTICLCGYFCAIDFIMVLIKIMPYRNQENL